MRYVDINEAKPGMILASTIYNNNAVLLAANKKLSRCNIERLKKLKFQKIRVYDSENEIHYKSLLCDAARKKIDRIKVEDCLFVANDITKDVLADTKCFNNIKAIKTYDAGTFMHCVNVARLATMIGVFMGFNNNVLRQISQAGLLHDIGKTKVDNRIITKAGKLTDLEYKEVKNHPDYSLSILQRNKTISETVLDAVYSHHENEDGSGYPLGLKGDKISVVAKIIHAADVYDALISKRSYKNPMEKETVLEYMTSHVGSLFDKTVVDNLMACVA